MLKKLLCQVQRAQRAATENDKDKQLLLLTLSEIKKMLEKSSTPA